MMCDVPSMAVFVGIIIIIINALYYSRFLLVARYAQAYCSVRVQHGSGSHYRSDYKFSRQSVLLSYVLLLLVRPSVIQLRK
jgi:hypothetical protein